MPLYQTLGNDPLGQLPMHNPKKAQTWYSNETLFEVCEALWSFLWENHYVDEDGITRYQGPISNWFREQKKTNLYSPIMHLMKTMDSAYIETKGSRWSGTIVRLVQPPTLEGVVAARTEEFFYEKPAISRRDAYAILQQSVDDLRKQVVQLEKRIADLELRRSHLNG